MKNSMANAVMYDTLVKMGLPIKTNPQQDYLGSWKSDFICTTYKLVVRVAGFNDRYQEHDLKLAKAGWTTLWFNKAEMKERLSDVKKVINVYLGRIEKSKRV